MRILARLAVKSWQAVRKILSLLESHQFAVLYPLLAHDYPDLAESFLPNKEADLGPILETGLLGAVLTHTPWRTYLYEVKRQLRANPRFLLNLLCDKNRTVGNRLPENDAKLSAIPLLDKYSHELIATAFHPLRPIVALIYKNPGGEELYKMLVHAFAGREREEKGSILYQSPCLRYATCDYMRADEKPGKLAWSPTGEFLLMFTEETKKQWRANLFRWNEAKCELRRIEADQLSPSSSIGYNYVFTDCWATPSTFYMTVSSPLAKSVELAKVTVHMDEEDETASIEAVDLRPDFLPVEKDQEVQGMWLLRRDRSPKKSKIVWAEKCQRDGHHGHSIVRFRTLGESCPLDEPDTQGFVLNSGIVLEGIADAAEPDQAYLLVAQHFQCLKLQKVPGDEDYNDELRLNWSAVRQEGLLESDCGHESLGVDDDGYWVDNYRAKWIVFVVKISFLHPDVPITVNVLKNFGYDFPMNRHEEMRNKATVLSQSKTELLLRLWPKGPNKVVAASKLLPVSYELKGCSSFSWHPSEQVYISRIRKNKFEYFYEQSTSEEDSDNMNVRLDFRLTLQSTFFVVLKHEKTGSEYENSLHWKNCQKVKRLCKRKRNQHGCPTCEALDKRIQCLEWSSPIASKVSKQHE